MRDVRDESGSWFYVSVVRAFVKGKLLHTGQVALWRSVWQQCARYLCNEVLELHVFGLHYFCVPQPQHVNLRVTSACQVQAINVLIHAWTRSLHMQVRDLVSICATKQSVLRRADGEVGDPASPALDSVVISGL